MKRIFPILLTLILIASFVIAACPCTASTGKETASAIAVETNSTQGQMGANETGAMAKGSGDDEEKGNSDEALGQDVQVEQKTENKGEEQNLTVQQRQEERVQESNGTMETVQARKQVTTQDLEAVKQKVQQKQAVMTQDMESMGNSMKTTYQNQKGMMLAVHTLLEMKNFTGGVGNDVAQIARDFNNSIQATMKAEEKIQSRSWFSKTFFGGDETAAGQMEQEVTRNQQMIRQLNELMGECDCSEEVKAMLQEQIQNMEQEQNRLLELAQEQKESKGLFGWLWK